MRSGQDAKGYSRKALTSDSAFLLTKGGVYLTHFHQVRVASLTPSGIAIQPPQFLLSSQKFLKAGKPSLLVAKNDFEFLKKSAAARNLCSSPSIQVLLSARSKVLIPHNKTT